MADNLKVLKSNLDAAINPNAGIGEILVQKHNDVFTEFINKSGKFTGLPFLSVIEATNGVVPTGVLVWNNNAMNKTDDFIITVSKKTLDLNHIDRILDTLSSDAIMHFKDFVGRSVFFKYNKHELDEDANGNDIYNIYLKGFSENTNYTYQIGESEVCVIEFIKSKSNIINFGELQIFRTAANSLNSSLLPLAGDTVVGQLNDGVFLTRGIYVSGPILNVTSYDQNLSDWFDPNDV